MSRAHTTRRAALRLACLLPVLCALPLAAFDLAGARQVAVAVKPVTIIFTRHAEKETGDPRDRDPALTTAGKERAEALARMLSSSGVTHLFSTELQRTRKTLAPLAKAVDLDVEVIKAAANADQLAALRALPGGAIAVVAGHSNTVPGMVHALGGEISGLTEHQRYGPMLGDDEYDRLFVVTIPAGMPAALGLEARAAVVQTLELRYGE